MKLAVLGGSFNPVHIGHLYLADVVLTGLGYDRVILVPAFQSPLKLNAEIASSKDRLDMLAASIPGDPRLTIDDCEIKREGVSYTVDTLKDIIARYCPEGKPGLILGDDLASTFYKWRNPGEISEIADIIIARRLPGPGDKAASINSCSGVSCSGETVSGETAEAGNFPWPHKYLENEIVDISSSHVREKISRGEAWRYLVPSGARCIIQDRNLYGFSSEDGDSLDEIIIRIENDVRSTLDLPRFNHSRNTALLAWDLCKIYGLDPKKGYLAGIAHDMCKKLDARELIRLSHKDGSSISKLEHAKPGLLHARAAAVLIKSKYGVTDKNVIEAIRYHTTGTRDMGPYAKVVYIADKIEISRFDVSPALRELSLNGDMDILFDAVLSETVAYLKSRQVDISYGTRRLLAAMNKRNKH